MSARDLAAAALGLAGWALLIIVVVRAIGRPRR